MAEPKSVEQMMKEGLIKKGDDPSLQIWRTATSIPSLNELLGDGIPLGRSILLYGPESTGKTLIAQYFAAAIQKREVRNQVIYVDLEGSFDRSWWEQSEVDTEDLMVSRPVTAEEGINMMYDLLTGMDTLGMFIVDSIPGLVPIAVINRKAEEPTVGGNAHLVTVMYQKLEHQLIEKGVVFVALNQMRSNIGGYDELAALPGGRAQRHYSHIILRTSRESWIKKGEDKVGFYMEVESKKNKTCSVPDGTSITIPFMAEGQIDMLTSYIEDAVKKGIIQKAGPYFKWAGKNHLGTAGLRQFFVDNPTEVEELRNSV